MSAQALMVIENDTPTGTEAKELTQAADQAVREAERAGAERVRLSTDLRGVMSDIHTRIEGYESTIERQAADLDAAAAKHAGLYEEYVLAQAANVEAMRVQREEAEREAEDVRRRHAEEMAALRAEHATLVETVRAEGAAELERQRQDFVEALGKFKAQVMETIGLERAENKRLNDENLRLCEENRELSRSVERLVLAIRQNVASIRQEDESLGRAIEGICGRSVAEIIQFVPSARD